MKSMRNGDLTIKALFGINYTMFHETGINQ